MLNKFADQNVNNGLHEGISKKQIVPGAIVTVAWYDVPDQDFLITNSGEFKNSPVNSKKLYRITGVSLPDFKQATFDQTQIVKVRMSPSDTAKAIGMQMP